MSAIRGGGREFCPMWTFCRQVGFLRCGRPHFLVQNTTDVSKFIVCLHGQGGWSARTIFEQGYFADNFSRFCADVLYGRSLISLILISLIIINIQWKLLIGIPVLCYLSAELYFRKQIGPRITAENKQHGLLYGETSAWQTFRNR